MKDETLLCFDDDEYEKNKGAIVPPIYQTSLFSFEKWDDIEQAFSNPDKSFIYSRLHNPGTRLVEKKIAHLAGGEDAKLTASGMGAISAAIMHFVNHGEHIITIKNVYAPANNFIAKFLKEKCNIESTFVEGTTLKQFQDAIRDNTRLIYLESPASITMELQDLEKIVALAKAKGIATIIDNTWCTPLFQKPLSIGVDMEVHSVSKYLNGHSDVVAGIMIGKEKDLNEILVEEHALLGAKMSPFESWLLLRSLRTLPVRMRQHMENGMAVARFLEDHEKIGKVYYPGLESFPQYELGKKQMTGYGSLLSFEIETDELEKVKSFVNALTLFHLGVSWGGHESLVYAPSISYSKELTPEEFKARDIKVGLIRIHVGLEHQDDLIEDLRRALDHL